MGEPLAREVLRRIREEVAARGEKPNFDHYFWAFVMGLGRSRPARPGG